MNMYKGVRVLFDCENDRKHYSYLFYIIHILEHPVDVVIDVKSI